MEPSLEDIAIQTLTSLESRLHRLEFLLHGAVPSRDANTEESPANSQPTLSRRLKKVEEGVQKLQSSHPELIKLLWLSMCSQSPTKTTSRCVQRHHKPCDMD